MKRVFLLNQRLLDAIESPVSSLWRVNVVAPAAVGVQRVVVRSVVDDRADGDRGAPRVSAVGRLDQQYLVAEAGARRVLLVEERHVDRAVRSDHRLRELVLVAAGGAP